MIVSTLTWALVEVTYDEPVPDASGKAMKTATFHDAYVFYETTKVGIHTEGGTPSLKISQEEPHRSILLARPKILHLTPWRAEFGAATWIEESGKIPRLVQCAVNCRFENYKRHEIEQERQVVEWILREAKKKPVVPTRDKHSGQLCLRSTGRSKQT
jgi:hypothetical protein